MASILDRYGIKEVADVTFYKLDDTGKPAEPVLYLDTLKVSTIEQTAENVEARGGKGNPALVSWDYNKEINVTLEDALFSAKSMAVMFGSGVVKSDSTSASADLSQIKKTIAFTATTSGTSAVPASWEGPQGKKYQISNALIYDETGASLTSDSIVSGKKYFATFDMSIKENTLGLIEVSANTFPGTYYITGDTYARSDINGNDEFFQFIIPKAKINAENTITLEAEGDPSVFNLSLRVLRPEDGVMMKLVKYDMAEISG